MPYYQTFIIKLDSVNRAKKSCYRQRLKKMPHSIEFLRQTRTFKKSLILTTLISLIYLKIFSINQKSQITPHISSNHFQFDNYSREMIEFLSKLGKNRTAYRIHQLGNMISYCQIHAN